MKGITTRFAALFAASAVALGLLTTGVQARTLEQVKADGKIIVATEGAYAPFNYYQGDKLTGFEVDLAEAIAKNAGISSWLRSASPTSVPVQ